MHSPVPHLTVIEHTIHLTEGMSEPAPMSDTAGHLRLPMAALLYAQYTEGRPHKPALSPAGPPPVVYPTTASFATRSDAGRRRDPRRKTGNPGHMLKCASTPSPPVRQAVLAHDQVKGSSQASRTVLCDNTSGPGV